MTNPPEINLDARTNTQRLHDDIATAMTNLARDWPHMIRPGETQAPGFASRSGSIGMLDRSTLPEDAKEHAVDQSFDLPHMRRNGVSDADVRRIDKIISLRDYARRSLADWCRVIIEDRGIENGATIPASTDVPGMAQFVRRHAEWLSGHDAAANAREELRDMAQRCHLIASPKPRDSMSIGRCPLQVPGELDVLETCGGDVRVRLLPDEKPGEAYGACNRCGEVAVASWWAERMFVDGEGSPLVTAAELIAVIAYQLHIVVTHEQVRQWKHRGKIVAEGYDSKGRTLYRHADVIDAIRGEARARAGA